MISTFQWNQHFRKVLVNKTFTHLQEQQGDVTRQSAHIVSNVKSSGTTKAFFRIPTIS